VWGTTGLAQSRSPLREDNQRVFESLRVDSKTKYHHGVILNGVKDLSKGASTTLFKKA